MSDMENMIGDSLPERTIIGSEFGETQDHIHNASLSATDIGRTLAISKPRPLTSSPAIDGPTSPDLAIIGIKEPVARPPQKLQIMEAPLQVDSIDNVDNPVIVWSNIRIKRRKRVKVHRQTPGNTTCLVMHPRNRTAHTKDSKIADYGEKTGPSGMAKTQTTATSISPEIAKTIRMTDVSRNKSLANLDILPFQSTLSATFEVQGFDWKPMVASKQKAITNAGQLAEQGTHDSIIREVTRIPVVPKAIIGSNVNEEENIASKEVTESQTNIIPRRLPSKSDNMTFHNGDELATTPAVATLQMIPVANPTPQSSSKSPPLVYGKDIEQPLCVTGASTASSSSSTQAYERPINAAEDTVTSSALYASQPTAGATLYDKNKMTGTGNGKESNRKQEISPIEGSSVPSFTMRNYFSFEEANIQKQQQVVMENVFSEVLYTPMNNNTAPMAKPVVYVQNFFRDEKAQSHKTTRDDEMSE